MSGMSLRGGSRFWIGWKMALPCLAAVMFILCIGGRIAVGDEFLSHIADVPVMPGMVEIAGASVAFDDPSGRIVETFASGPVARAAVSAFYAATLPRLGWIEIDATTYRRDREKLQLDFVSGSGDVTVRFLLTPR
ncbi:MAG: hypothetical protein ACKVSF_06515 [Alphaproteobacteria bacterium]